MNTVTSKDIFSVYKSRILLEVTNKFNRQQFTDKLNKKADIFRDALMDVATRIDMTEQDQKEAIDEIFHAAQENIIEYIKKNQSEIEQGIKNNEYSTQGLVDDLNSAFGNYLGKVATITGAGEWKMTFPPSSKWYPENRSQQTAQQNVPAAPAPQQPQSQPQSAQAFTPPSQNSTQQSLTPTKNASTAVPLNPSQPLSQQQINPFTGQPVVPGQNQQSQNVGWNPFANSFKPGPGNAATYVPKSGPLAGTKQPVYPSREQAYAQKEAGQSPLANTGSVLADFNRRRAYLSGRGY